MKDGRYILLCKLAVPEPNLLKWGRWLETNGRHVADTKIGGVRISTVFLGLDHNHSGEGLPILFETLIFRGGAGAEMIRYETWEQAEAGHKAAVEKIRTEIKEKVNK